MPQRWMKILAFCMAATLVVSACRKSEFSKDEKLPESFSTSLYITSQNEFLYALDPRTGEKKWEYYVGSHVEATPVIIGEHLYLPTTDSLIKLDAKRGKLVKKYWMNNSIFQQFIASPAVDGNNIIIGALNDTLYSLNTVTENVNWYFNAGGDILSSPTVSAGQVILGAGNKVFALDVATGAKKWEFTGGAAFTSSATVSGPFVFIGCLDGNLYVLDFATGAAKWSYDTKAQILSSPIVYGGNVIFGSNNSKL
ncbi:MAG: pyrrolo-quinoline quinone, partial [Flavipsychrobacter sp.]|nr:pyrrolo-quinoline quinone [Flavipsychrobacter sp.]